MSFDASFDVQVTETRERVARLEEACAEVGREPATLERSYLMFDAEARPRGGTYGYYESVDRFEEMAGRIVELGMDELVIYYPPDERQLPTFERIATDVLPRFRAGTTTRPQTS